MPSTSTTLLPSSNPYKGSKTLAQSALAGFGNLLRLLPSGTVFIFEFLNPILTNNGNCHAIHKYLSIVLIISCALSCFVSSFTDSYIDSQGNIHYGFVTTKGLWPGSSELNQSSHRLHVGDFVHAFLGLIVFAVLALLHPGIVECFYPELKTLQRALLMALPPVIGVVSGAVFVLFPNTRHGIGHPRAENSSLSPTSA